MLLQEELYTFPVPNLLSLHLSHQKPLLPVGNTFAIYRSNMNNKIRVYE